MESEVKITPADDNAKNNQNNRNALAVFLRLLPTGATAADLSKLFEPIGSVTRTDVNSSKGFGFVDFADTAGVAASLAKYRVDPTYFTINGQQVTVEERTKPHPRGSAKGNLKEEKGKSNNESSVADTKVDAVKSAEPVTNKRDVRKPREWRKGNGNSEAEQNSTGKQANKK